VAKDKHAKFGATPPNQKVSKVSPAARGDFDDLKPAWRFGMMCLHDGPWSWNNATKDDILKIQERLSIFETMTWTQIGQAGSHTLNPDSLSTEARGEIRRRNLDEFADCFYSLRYDGGVPRIIGVRDRNVLRIIWWDPLHRFCPSHKKHT